MSGKNEQNMQEIIIATPVDKVPDWAVLERKLIDLMNDAVEPLLEKYVRPDGSLLWPPGDEYSGIDALDDAYESFHNWPLFYVLGGHEKFLEYSRKEYDAITRQFSRYDCGFGHPMVVKEYEQGYDWFHQGEGYLFFYMLGLADPENGKNRERAIRYAGFYLNEDPEVSLYDEERKLIKAPHVGSMGPGFRNFNAFVPWAFAEWKEYYGLPFQDIPGCVGIHSVKEHGNAVRMGTAMKERMARGDTAVNLAATSMVVNAYLHTGKTKYKDWIRVYVEAWMERTRENGGILPDNVGLTGSIGEYTKGKWYGGYYGWTWPHGWGSIGSAVVIAAENARLLLRDEKYLDLGRAQIKVLLDNGIEAEGTLHVPHKYGDPGSYEYRLWIRNVLTEDLQQSRPFEINRLLWKNGWFEFYPMDPMYAVHLWFVSRTDTDLAAIQKIRNHHRRDWEKVQEVPAKDQGGHEAAWVAYLQGEYPEYPVHILEYNLSQVQKRLAFMESDRQDPKTYSDSYLQARNPITVEGLVQLTMGGPLPVYNGGLLMASVRYFDLDGKRPGLPPDVAALVEKIEDSRTTLRLINMSSDHTRRIIVQGGAYGEHEILAVRIMTHGEDTLVRVDGKYLQLVMQPNTEAVLELEMRRYARTPSYRLPWSACLDLCDGE